MAKKLITQEKIIEAALFSAAKKSMGETSLFDIASALNIKKASLYNHFKSKEEMLKALYVYCSDYFTKVNYFSEEVFSKLNTQNAPRIFKQATISYVKLIESEPFLQIYTFVSSEKYFYKECLDIFLKQRSKIETQVFLFLKMISSKKQNDDALLKKEASFYCNSFFSQLDFYVATKMQTIRENPECDAGSLFALPSDDKTITTIAKLAEAFIQEYIK